MFNGPVGTCIQGKRTRIQIHVTEIYSKSGMQISSFISLLDFKANIGNLLARVHATRNKETKA